MLNIMINIRNELQESSILNYIKDENIFITELENYIPDNSKFPLITVKDYGSINDQQLLKKYYQTSRVLLTIFSRLLKIGHTLTDLNSGILKIEQDIISILIDNKLDNTEITNAFPITQEMCRNITREKDIISYKRIIMEYTLHKKWT